MAEDLTGHSDRLIADGHALVRDNRAGGRHRGGPPIGRGSAGARRRHVRRKAINVVVAMLAIIIAAGIAGVVIGGLGFGGLMLTVLALLAAVVTFSLFPRMKVPQRDDLARTQDPRQLVARTEMWLESQRPALPAPAVRLVNSIGVQLDALGAQLQHVDPAHPAAGETRKLVGEILPEMIDSYRRIPAHLRTEERAGSSPDHQLVESLGRISGEIDHVTRQLAEGSLDDLAVRTRYLDYKFGGADALPSPEKS